MSALLRGPSFVKTLTIQNPTDYRIEVEVSGGGIDTWTPLTSVAKQSSAAIDQVVDQGKTWHFRFSSTGHVGGELAMTRAQLAAANWHVIVPADVSARLAAAGASKSVA
jgi:hypothetical protein